MTPDAALKAVNRTYRSFVDAGVAFKALADRGERSAAVDAVLHVHEACLHLVEAQRDALLLLSRNETHEPISNQEHAHDHISRTA